MGAFDRDGILIDNAGMLAHTTITMDRSNTGFASASGGAAYTSLGTLGAAAPANFTLTAIVNYATMTLAIAPYTAP